MATSLMSMQEVAEPLWAIAFMLGSESDYLREEGQQALVNTVMQMASYIYMVDHMKTCRACAARQRMLEFLRERTS